MADTISWIVYLGQLTDPIRWIVYLSQLTDPISRIVYLGQLADDLAAELDDYVMDSILKQHRPQALKTVLSLSSQFIAQEKTIKTWGDTKWWNVLGFNVKVQLTDFWSMLLMLSDPDRIRSQNQNPNPKTGFFFYYQKLRKFQMKEKFNIF
jgi:hypothetical protein